MAQQVGDAPAPHALAPDRWFIQIGGASQVQSANVGLIWELDRKWQVLDDAQVSVFTEASIGRWHVDDAGGSARSTNTQIGFTPTVRLTFPGEIGWFTELGIGLNFIVPIYRSNERRFSTVFNFGDHIAVGARPWGPSGSEISLRIQHFSNAGIEHPNPGENFLQIRWTHPL